MTGTCPTFIAPVRTLLFMEPDLARNDYTGQVGPSIATRAVSLRHRNRRQCSRLGLGGIGRSGQFSAATLPPPSGGRAQNAGRGYRVVRRRAGTQICGGESGETGDQAGLPLTGRTTGFWRAAQRGGKGGMDCKDSRRAQCLRRAGTGRAVHRSGLGRRAAPPRNPHRRDWRRPPR